MVALNAWELSSRFQVGDEGVPHLVPGKKWDAVERVPTNLGAAGARWVIYGSKAGFDFSLKGPAVLGRSVCLHWSLRDQ